MAEKKNRLFFVQKGIIVLIAISIIVILLIGLVGEIDKFRRIIWGVEEEVVYQKQDLSGYLSAEVRQVVYSHAQEVVTYPVNANITKKTGKIKSEVEGQILDLTQTIDNIFSAVEGSKVEPVIYPIFPYLKKDQLKKITKNIGIYNTTITGNEKRRANIKLGAKLINNELLLPGEIFSFNQIVGPRTKSRGFKESFEIAEGKLVLGIGGGVCQVSSTLFNALNKKELKILERHTHSKEVGYVPEGKDATVAWDYLDFKFKNNFKFPIIIKCITVNNKLIVKILGHQSIDI